MLCKYGCGNKDMLQLKNDDWIYQDSFNECPVN